MEKFGATYDNLSTIYSGLEDIMVSIYEDLQNDPTNVEKSNLLQGLGNVALKVLYSQMQFVDDYEESHLKENLLSSLDSKAAMLSDTLSRDRDRTR